MSWNSNNRAHACVWLIEIWRRKQENIGFDEVRTWKTGYIIGAAKGDTIEMRGQKAQTHAEYLDGAFINLFGASYEQGVNQDTAIDAMLNVLNNRNKTMVSLADSVDGLYRFLGETI